MYFHVAILHSKTSFLRTQKNNSDNGITHKELLGHLYGGKRNFIKEKAFQYYINQKMFN